MAGRLYSSLYSPASGLHALCDPPLWSMGRPATHMTHMAVRHRSCCTSPSHAGPRECWEAHVARTEGCLLEQPASEKSAEACMAQSGLR